MRILHLAVVSLLCCSGHSNVLLPPDGTALHCGGQSPDAFGNYSAFLGELTASSHDILKHLMSTSLHASLSLTSCSTPPQKKKKNKKHQTTGKSAPGVYMVYTDLAGLKTSWFTTLKLELDAQGSKTNSFIIPQIGLSLPGGSLLAKVARGGYATSIAALVAGLKILERPAYVRVGYEFNGQWNNYPPTDYITVRSWPGRVYSVSTFHS